MRDPTNHPIPTRAYFRSLKKYLLTLHKLRKPVAEIAIVITLVGIGSDPAMVLEQIHQWLLSSARHWNKTWWDPKSIPLLSLLDVIPAGEVSVCKALRIDRTDLMLSSAAMESWTLWNLSRLLHGAQCSHSKKPTVTRKELHLTYR